MVLLHEWFALAEGGFRASVATPVAILLFGLFAVWAFIMDIRTMKVKNKLNLAFLLVGVCLWIVPGGSLSLGLLHPIGLVVGFLLLFIPGMIANHAFGGDIKFVSVMGFWTGPYAISLILLVACLIQLLFFFGHWLFRKNASQKATLPFAPAFTVSYYLLLLWVLF